MKPNVIIIADRHELAEPILTLIALLPFLKQKGFTTICLEGYSKMELSPKILLEQKREIFEANNLFPDGSIPSKLSTAQAKFIHKLQSLYDVPPGVMIAEWHYVKKAQGNAHEHIVPLYELIVNLKMEIEPIDIDGSSDYKLEKTIERTQHIFERVMEISKKRHNIIVFCGLNHVVNMWRTNELGVRCRYDSGLINILKINGNFNVKGYFVTPTKYEALACDENEVSSSGKKPNNFEWLIIPSNDEFPAVIDDIKKRIEKPLTGANSSSSSSSSSSTPPKEKEYVTPILQRFQSDLEKYIVDLGGKIIARNTSEIKISIPEEEKNLLDKKIASLQKHIQEHDFLPNHQKVLSEKKAVPAISPNSIQYLNNLLGNKFEEKYGKLLIEVQEGNSTYIKLSGSYNKDSCINLAKFLMQKLPNTIILEVVPKELGSNNFILRFNMTEYLNSLNTQHPNSFISNICNSML